MASNFCSLSVNIRTLFFIILLFLPRAVTAVPELELESMLAVVRARGYNLFCNAIITSDIHYEVLAGTSFTFFAPTDSSLFALDMTATSSDYITSLRYHVIPRRYSLADLRTLPPGSSLHTLVQHLDIRIERRPSIGYDIITADGVDVVMPGLYYGRDIAVHGLGGILSFRSQIGQHQDSLPPQISDVGDRHAPPPRNSSNFARFEPPISEGMDNITVVSPEPGVASVDGFSPMNPPETGGFHFGISQPYGLSPGISITPALAPKAQAPVPSLPDYDNPTSPSPSSIDRFGDHDRDSDRILAGLILSERYEASLADVSNDMENSKAKSSAPGELPLTTPLRKEVVARVTAITPEIPSPYDPDTSEF